MSAFSAVSRETPIIAFVNPLASGARAVSYVPQIQKVFSSRQLPVEFIFTESTNDLESRAREAIAKDCRMLLAMGGDGTFQGLANAAFGSNVVVGILPTGGGNDFAHAIGIPRNPVQAARAILSARPQAIDLLRARTGDGRERLYVGGGGIGLDAEAAVHASTTYRHLRGRLRYVAAALRAFREFEPLTVRAEFPGTDWRPIQGRALLAAALNTPTYGAGIRLAPDARIDDGLLATALVNDLNALEVAALLPRLVVRGDVPDSRVQRVSARRVRFSADRQCLFHGDGEVLGPTPVEVEVLPDAIRVLVPATI